MDLDAVCAFNAGVALRRPGRSGVRTADEEAIAIANSTCYGLSSFIQTRDLTRAHRIAAELEAGEVLINGAPSLAPHRPFGGVGISGVGKEGGQAGFEEFLHIKSVAVAIR